MKTILVIEDDEDTLNLHKNFFESNGYSVVTASDGNGALEKAISENPDLIMLDLVLPGKNGFELCKDLKTKVDTSNIPIIVTSALVGDEDCQRALGAGAVGYMTKPLNSHVTIAAIEDILKKN